MKSQNSYISAFLLFLQPLLPPYPVIPALLFNQDTGDSVCWWWWFVFVLTSLCLLPSISLYFSSSLFFSSSFAPKTFGLTARLPLTPSQTILPTPISPCPYIRFLFREAGRKRDRGRWWRRPPRWWVWRPVRPPTRAPGKSWASSAGWSFDRTFGIDAPGLPGPHWDLSDGDRQKDTRWK